MPNQYNVAVALTQAQINLDKTSPDYLLQNLDHVYTYSDSRDLPDLVVLVRDHPDRGRATRR